MANTISIHPAVDGGVKPGVKYDVKNLDQLASLLEGKVHYHRPSLKGYPKDDRTVERYD